MNHDKIMNLMMEFGRNNPDGFQQKELLDFLVSNGIDMDEAKKEMDFQDMTMDIFDDDEA